MTDVKSSLKKTKHLVLLSKIHVQTPTKDATCSSVLFFTETCKAILDYSMTVNHNDGVIKS